MSEFVTVETPGLRLVFWPRVGGRLISASADGVDYLWRNPDYLTDEPRLVLPRDRWSPLDGTMASWANVGGSKTWPAPQGWGGPHEWAGPPDPVLDSGEWSGEVSRAADATTVTMVSPDDPRTGLRVTRRFVVPHAGTEFRQTIEFRNVSGASVRWSIWEVCQVDTAGLAGVGSLVVGSSDAAPVRAIEAVGTIEVGEHVNGAWRVPVQDVVGKLCFAGADGFVALERPDGGRLELGFDAVPGAVYPDGGARVELWLQYPIEAPLPQFDGLHPRADLVELEVLGPLVDLAPGEATELELAWRLN